MTDGGMLTPSELQVNSWVSLFRQFIVAKQLIECAAPGVASAESNGHRPKG